MSVDERHQEQGKRGDDERDERQIGEVGRSGEIEAGAESSQCLMNQIEPEECGRTLKQNSPQDVAVNVVAQLMRQDGFDLGRCEVFKQRVGQNDSPRISQPDQRGEMENRIKEQQLALFADRTSTGTLRGNQIRLYFSSFAYLLMAALRRLGLKGTELARAQGQTIRLKLLKIGALLRVTARKVWVSIAESYPYAAVFGQVYRNLKAVPLRC